MFEVNNIYCGDMLEVMKDIDEDSIDFIFSDLPYGSTKCRWDHIIPFDAMWENFNRVTKKNSVVALTATQPFGSLLVASNIKNFKHEWIWDKKTARGHLVAKKRPMQQHESVLIFCQGTPRYYPIMTLRDKPVKGKEYKRTAIMGGESVGYEKIYTHAYPKTILSIGMDRKNGHPTQKPVALVDYLIRTYTVEGDLVLDPCIGSGTTGVAAVQRGRNYIGIELDSKFVSLSNRRIYAIPGR